VVLWGAASLPPEILYLTVYENNSRAIAFYKKMGFSRYILNSKPQNVLLDAGTSNEHTDICLICNLLGTSHNS